MVTRYTRWCVSDTWKMINHPVRKGDINYTRTVCESVWRERASVSSWSKVRGYIVDSRVDNGLYRWCRADPPSLYSLNRLLLYVSWLHRFSSLINLYRIALFLLPGGIRVNIRLFAYNGRQFEFSLIFFNIYPRAENFLFSSLSTEETRYLRFVLKTRDRCLRVSVPMWTTLN